MPSMYSAVFRNLRCVRTLARLKSDVGGVPIAGTKGEKQEGNDRGNKAPKHRKPQLG